MKKTIFLIFSVIFISFYSNAQFKKGNVELSFLGSLGSNKTETESGSSSSSSSRMYFMLNIQPSYYIIDGLALGFGIDFLAIEKEKPTQSILANISYTYRFPRIFSRALWNSRIWYWQWDCVAHKR